METEAKTGLTPLEEEMLAALKAIDEQADKAMAFYGGIAGYEQVKIARDLARTAISKAESLKAQAAQAENGN